jgi:hypothetical protein
MESRETAKKAIKKEGVPLGRVRESRAEIGKLAKFERFEGSQVLSQVCRFPGRAGPSTWLI